MDPDRWHQVEVLFEAALAKEPGQRDAFLSQAGASDEVRREVASLLAECATGGSPLDHPAWPGALSDAGSATGEPAARRSPGAVLGPYQIENEIGAGAMGIVYRAHDTRLYRHVAIKFLLDASASPSLRRRFQYEARMASALNHPHILTVHDTGEVESHLYIVTELVDGGTLRGWCESSRTWEEVVDLLCGVADGLASAHAAGILHRDIKPANMLISRNGYAKLADFGLAKLATGAERHSPT